MLRDPLPAADLLEGSSRFVTLPKIIAEGQWAAGMPPAAHSLRLCGACDQRSGRIRAVLLSSCCYWLLRSIACYHDPVVLLATFKVSTACCQACISACLSTAAGTGARRLRV